AYFDATGARPRKLGRHAHGLVDAVGLDDVEARDHLLRLRERAVEGDLTLVADPHRLRLRRLGEDLSVEQLAFALQVVGVRKAAAHPRVELAAGQLVEQRLVVVNQQYVLHGTRSPVSDTNGV